MKVTLVIDHLGAGGAQRQTVVLAQTLASRGHDVSVFLYYPENDHFRYALDEMNIPVMAAAKKHRYSLEPARRLRAHLRHEGVDAAVAYLSTPNLYTIMAGLGLPTRVIASEGSELPEGAIALSRRAQLDLYRFADFVVINSFHQRERLIRSFAWIESMSRTITNGIDLHTFYPAANYTRSSNGRLLAVGTIQVGKNALNLIDALGKLKERTGKVPEVHWAGRMGSSAADVEMKAEADRRVEAHGLGDTWKWLGVRRDVSDLMRTYDGLVHPSFSEGLPNAICEALSSGLPVLAGDVCDHPWLVGEGIRGLLFDPERAAHMADVLEKWSSLSEGEYQSMRQAARAFAEKELSVERYGDRFEDLLHRLVESE